jgi:hypothetical protein
LILDSERSLLVSGLRQLAKAWTPPPPQEKYAKQLLVSGSSRVAERPTTSTGN